jgi:hypothetical protein
MLSRRQFAVIAATFTAAVMSGAQSLDQEFPPLAGVNIVIGNQIEIDRVLGALREFGRLERLTISEDKILKQGLTTKTLYLGRRRSRH